MCSVSAYINKKDKIRVVPAPKHGVHEKKQSVIFEKKGFGKIYISFVFQFSECSRRFYVLFLWYINNCLNNLKCVCVFGCVLGLVFYIMIIVVDDSYNVLLEPPPRW